MNVCNCDFMDRHHWVRTTKILIYLHIYWLNMKISIWLRAPLIDDPSVINDSDLMTTINIHTLWHILWSPHDLLLSILPHDMIMLNKIPVCGDTLITIHDRILMNSPRKFDRAVSFCPPVVTVRSLCAASWLWWHCLHYWVVIWVAGLFNFHLNRTVYGVCHNQNTL